MKFMGIEIGGTKLQAALGNGAGEILHLERTIARSSGGREAICQQIVELVDAIIAATKTERSAVGRVGIGFGGPVNPRLGTVRTSHQVDGWNDFPLGDWFHDATGLRPIVGNDSDLAGLAEAHFGAGQGKSRVAYMNIGSGIGGALVIDGRLYASQGEGASEIGHLRIRPGHPGAPWQTLEDLASGWSLARAARRVAEADDTSNIYRRVEGLTSKITAQTLIQAVEERDPPAVDIWLKAIEHWSVAIANVITLFRPEVFVIGGGVALAGDILFEPLKREVARQVFAPFLDSYDILPAALGEEVVVHGALKLASDVV